MSAASSASAVGDLVALSDSGAFDELIFVLREQVTDDIRVLAHPWVKQWIGRRWRDVFLTEASRDPDAVGIASLPFGSSGHWRLPRGRDRRPQRQRLAERFLARDVEDWKVEYPAAVPQNSVDATVVYCPSFAHSAVPLLGFGAEFPIVADELGFDVVRAATHGFRGAEANAENIHQALVQGIGTDAAGRPIAAPRAPDDVVLFGYSKGGADAHTFQGLHPELAGSLRAVVTWAAPIGGTPLADDAARLLARMPLSLGQQREQILTVLRTILPIANLDGLLDRPDEWDLKQAILDLTTLERARFLARYDRTIDDTNVPSFTLAGAVSPLEVPYFQLPGSLVVARRAGKNDMQVPVAATDARRPMSTPLAVVRAHHWDLALGEFPASHRIGSARLAHHFPRLAALRATFLVLQETGLLRKHIARSSDRTQLLHAIRLRPASRVGPFLGRPM